ncbi:hypothetical protein ABBQ38_004469 [Trebouxia sp. C0009 RCD-2024]
MFELTADRGVITPVCWLRVRTGLSIYRMLASCKHCLDCKHNCLENGLPLRLLLGVRTSTENEHLINNPSQATRRPTKCIHQHFTIPHHVSFLQAKSGHRTALAECLEALLKPV